MTFPKIPQMPGLSGLSDLLKQIQKFDCEKIAAQIDEFLATAHQVEATCMRIERKLDAVINAAEIKVSEDGNTSDSSDGNTCIAINSGRNC